MIGAGDIIRERDATIARLADANERLRVTCRELFSEVARLENEQWRDRTFGRA